MFEDALFLAVAREFVHRAPAQRREAQSTQHQPRASGSSVTCSITRSFDSNPAAPDDTSAGGAQLLVLLELALADAGRFFDVEDGREAREDAGLREFRLAMLSDNV